MMQRIAERWGMSLDPGTGSSAKDDDPGRARKPRRTGVTGVLAGAVLFAAVIAWPSLRSMHHHEATQREAAARGWIAPGVMMVGRPTTISVKPVTTDALSHVPGKSVTVEIVEFQPGARSPEHHHAGSVTVYVLAGTVRSQLAGSPPMVYQTGQSFFEPPGAVHLFAENPSPTDVARIMAIHVADDGAQLTTFH
jgi:quercetin dioxygenase-like cupin family protein